MVPFDWSVEVSPTDSDETIAANVMAALKEVIHADLYTSCGQLVGKYINFEDKSEEQVMQKFNLQKTTKVQRKKYMHEYQHDRGLDYHNVLLTLDGKEDMYKAVIIENGGIIRGVKVTDTNGILTAFAGIELDKINTLDMKDGTPETISEFKWMLIYANASELNEDTFVVGTSLNVYSELEPFAVVDLKAIPFSATSNFTHPIMIETEDGTLNVGDTLGDILADTDLIATATNDLSGLDLDLLSVSYNAGTKKYILVFDSGGGYVHGQVATLTFASTSVLHGLDADYYRIRKSIKITMLDD